ncbi:MAG: glycoside hydrolase family 9 protein [Planctomycetota bacterium]
MRRLACLACWILVLRAPATAQEIETDLYTWNDNSVDGWTLPRGNGFSTAPAPIPEGAGCLSIDVPASTWDQGVRKLETSVDPALPRARVLRLDVHLDAAFSGTWLWLVPVFISAADGWYPLESRAVTRKGDWLTLQWTYDPARIDPSGYQLILVTQTDAPATLFIDRMRVVEPASRVLVDQFGYCPDSRKVVVFTEDPGPGFEVRQASNDQVVYRVPQKGGSIVPWQGGAVDEVSGDRVWHGDFTGLRLEGRYYITSTVGRSVDFEVRSDIFDALARQAAKSLYFDRCGVALQGGAAGPWQHSACHVADGQDRTAMGYLAGQVTGAPKDVSGGWHHGGGDYGKYVTHLGEILWFLMRAYEADPALFADGSTNIPESGNGIPDLLDEIAVELRWLRKMQAPDGSFHHKVSALKWYDSMSPPEAYAGPRYVTETSTRATAIAAGLCARGAKLFYGHDPGFASKLQWDAEQAWEYLEEHPHQIPAGGFKNSGEMTSPEGSGGAIDDRVARMFAAVELYRLTRSGKYRNYFEDRWDSVGGPRPIDRIHPDDRFLLALSAIDYIDARNGNSRFLRDIKEALKDRANEIAARSDAYRSPMDRDDYRFASNRLKVQWATILIEADRLRVGSFSNDYREKAEEYLHYLHGRNPLGQVYLTNAGSLGAENPVLEPFHFWFQDGDPLFDGAGSTHGPVPMMMVNGPNDFYHGTLSPPLGASPSKAHVDTNSNTGEWVERSWEFNEPAIGRTAAYVYLVSSLTCRSGGRDGEGQDHDDDDDDEDEDEDDDDARAPRVKSPHGDARRRRPEQSPSSKAGRPSRKSNR